MSLTISSLPSNIYDEVIKMQKAEEEMKKKISELTAQQTNIKRPGEIAFSDLSVQQKLEIQKAQSDSSTLQTLELQKGFADLSIPEKLALQKEFSDLMHSPDTNQADRIAFAARLAQLFNSGNAPQALGVSIDTQASLTSKLAQSRMRAGALTV